MTVIKHKTDGNVNPTGKPRVYFTCHPDDFDTCFEQIAADFFRTHDCAFYYKANMSEQVPDLEMELGRSNLVVVPVTRSLLTTPNIAMDEEVPYALESGIPVLPIMLDTGIEHIYSREDRFGELQFLSPYIMDKTSIPYEEKLDQYLKTVLFSDALAARIRGVFRAYAFLSYRKKDRRYANELMKQIHTHPDCWDTAIWFDEFLTPGESFRTGISRKLEESQAFVLLVTPSILEEPDGKPNFIMEVEYPDAKKLALPILPVEMQTTDRTQLILKYSQLPEHIWSTDELRSTNLTELIPSRPLTQEYSMPERQYLVGLAYLEGIDMEIDRRRGLELLRQAADSGWLEAARRLASMYLDGIFVTRDLASASHWQKKTMDLLKERCRLRADADNAMELVDAIRMYVEIERNRSQRECSLASMIDQCQKALLLGRMFAKQLYGADRKQAMTSVFKTTRTLAILYELLGAYDTAKQLYFQCLQQSENLAEDDEKGMPILNLILLAQTHHDYGVFLLKTRNIKGAAGELETALELYEKAASYTVAVSPIIVDVHNLLVYVYSHYDNDLAAQHSQLSVRKAEALYRKNPGAYDLTYAQAMFSHAYYLIESGSVDFDEQKRLCLLGIEIFDRHKVDSNHLVMSTYMNALYTLAGIYRRCTEYAQAKHYYLKSIAEAERVKETAEYQDLETIAHLYFDYATSNLADYQNPAIDEATKYMQAALSMFRDLVRVEPKNQHFVDECQEKLKTLDELAKTPPTKAPVPSEKPEMLEVGEKYLMYYSVGDTAEKMEHYLRGFAYYQEALKYLVRLKELNVSIGLLSFADLYDRMAYCCEMMGQYDQAFHYYKEYAQTAAMALKDEEQARNELLKALGKLESFCKDYVSKKYARKYRRLATLVRLFKK